MKKFLIITFAIFILNLTNFSASQDSGWERIAPNNYVYMDGITGLENIYGYSFLMKSYNKGQYEPINGKQILYTLNQYELDCGKKKYKIGLMDSYDENGMFINGDYNKYANFQPIVPQTAVYEIYKQLCKF